MYVSRQLHFNGNRMGVGINHPPSNKAYTCNISQKDLTIDLITIFFSLFLSFRSNLMISLM